MQHGEEALPDFQNFLTNWITYLGDKAGRDADRLFLEAVSMLNNVSAACNYAEKFVVNHPGLYLYILENEKSVELGTMVSIGMQAMKRIPKKYESDTSPLNYIRALLHGYGTEKKREELRKVYMLFSADEDRNPYEMMGYSNLQFERKENKPDRNTILMIRFFDGQFAEVLKD